MHLFPSPLEYLKAFAISFLAGAASVIAAHVYARYPFGKRPPWC
jgi:TRAP-type C4-dicarboxylate transport system permease small subunit